MTSKQTLIWLLKHTKGIRRLMLFLIVSGILFSMSSIFFIYTSKEIIDTAVEQDLLHLKGKIIQLFVIIGLQLFFRLLNPNLEEFLRAKTEIMLRQDLANSLFQQDYQQVTNHHSGEWLTHFFSDIETITEGIVTAVSTLFKRGAELLFALVLLFSIEPYFFYLIVSGGTAIMVLSHLLRRHIKTILKQVQEKKGLVLAHIQEILEQFTMIKVYQGEDFVLNRLEAKQKDYLRLRNKHRRFIVLAGSSFILGYQLAYFAAISWGAMGIYQGTLTYGALSAMLQLVSQIMGPISAMSGTTSKMYAMLACSERLMALEKTAQTRQKKTLPKKGNLKAVSFDQASFSYLDRDIFNQANFRIEQGQFVALMGPSGIGKTSLFQVLLGFYPLDSGDIHLEFIENDQTVTYSLKDYDCRSMMAYVPQGNTLFSGTIRDNLLLSKKNANDEQIWQALNLACAADFIEELPNQLDHLLIERGKNLSEGQRQRLVIARALLADRPILLMDEMTSALDELIEEQLLSHLAQLTDKIVLIISHKQSTRVICHRALMLSDTIIREERIN